MRKSYLLSNYCIAVCAMRVIPVLSMYLCALSGEIDVRAVTSMRPCRRWDAEPEARGPPVYRILKFLMGSSGLDSVLLAEGHVVS